MTTKEFILYMNLLKLCFSLLADSITGQYEMLEMFYSHMTTTHMVIDAGMSGNSSIGPQLVEAPQMLCGVAM